jgi:hypothetical protein
MPRADECRDARKEAFMVEKAGRLRYHQGKSNMKGAIDEGEDRP